MLSSRFERFVDLCCVYACIRYGAYCVEERPWVQRGKGTSLSESTGWCAVRNVRVKAIYDAWPSRVRQVPINCGARSPSRLLSIAFCMPPSFICIFFFSSTAVTGCTCVENREKRRKNQICMFAKRKKTG